MKIAKLNKRLDNIQKGAYTSIVWERNAHIKRSCPYIIKKRVFATCRVGINYKNIGYVKNSLINGERNNDFTLPWGQWERYPYIIQHTNKKEITNRYLRLYLGTNQSIRSEWYLNGRIVNLEDIKQYLLSSELKELELDKTIPVTVNVNDILSIG